ncbi:MAG: type II toxin-antitoxin system Phd/YefM family antitoxin [Chloroflexales bacterium]|nr:type II toxin-antitoxin system Phd/YefM family antitoxin [Chloroflexales bacterium]
MPQQPSLDLDVDLQSGVVPISKAASTLAALIKRGKERRQPIIVTQKGYPTGVLLSVDLYASLRDLAQRGAVVALNGTGDADALPPVALTGVATAGEERSEVLGSAAASTPAEQDAPPARRGRGGRRAKAQP